MAKDVLTLTGHKELMRALEQLTPKLEKKVLRQAMRKAAKPIHTQAKLNAPVGQMRSATRDIASRTVKLGKALGASDKQIGKARARVIRKSEQELKKSGSRYPGQLRDSIKVRAMKSKKGRVGVVVQTREGDYRGKTFYGAFIEYGRKGMPAQPYMRPAFDTRKSDSFQILFNEIKNGVQTVGSEVGRS